MFSGDEYYGDDITSGPIDTSCETQGHLWIRADGGLRRRGEKGHCRDCGALIGADE